MVTESINIKNISVEDSKFILGQQNNYTYAFHFLYKKSDENKDKELISYVKKRFSLTDIGYRSVISESNQLKSAFETQKKEKQSRIDDIESELIELSESEIKEQKKDKPSKRKLEGFTRKIFKLKKKKSILESSLSNDIVFGGRDNLKKISYLSNPPKKEKKKVKSNKGINKKKQEAGINKKDEEFSIEYWRKEYQDNRLKPIYIIGESNQGANRFFEFHLNEDFIIYKPNKKTKIRLDLTNYHNKKELYKKLQEAIDNDSISITVQLDTKNINLSFDIEQLTKYAIDTKARRKEVEKIKKECAERKATEKEKKELINLVYKKYYEAQRKERLIGKIEHRSLNLDLNPEFIGYSITQREGDKMRLLKCGSYSFKKLIKNLGKDSTSEEQLHQNNKREHELLHVLIQLFVIAKHYKVSLLITEILNIEPNENLNTEANRKIKNLWNRQLILGFIKKNCLVTGIEHKPVPAMYSSFIGNLRYNYIDPIAASIEIGRRGLFQFEKNKFYPVLDDTTIHTLEALKSGDVDLVKGDQTSWVKLYSFAQSNEIRWRRRLRGTEHYAEVSMNTKNSKVKVIEYFPNGIYVPC